uniref:Uncharacterized protein n=1 Tax=Varanus komodoensis TaxID=61221 RepID=A0A8D2LSJ1_VARKO
EKTPHSQSKYLSLSLSLSLRMEDLAIRPGFLDFFSAYCFSRSSRTRAASWSSSSSSLPNRSMSSSSSSAAAAAAGEFLFDGTGSPPTSSPGTCSNCNVNLFFLMLLAA